MPRRPRIRNPKRPILVIDVPTAAALLDVSSSTLYRWMAEGKFPYITLPSGVMKISLQHISDVIGFTVDYLMQVVRSM